MRGKANHAKALLCVLLLALPTRAQYGGGTGDDDVGGLLGSNNGIMIDCYTTAEARGNKRVGGLVGAAKRGTGHGYSSSVIERCFAVGRISGDEHVGGLAGLSEPNSFIRHSIWDIESTGRPASAGGEGRTTAEMQTAGTYLEAGWDFVGETKNGTVDIWHIGEGSDYPTFAWMDFLR